jgi:hypothetical protein
VRINIIQEGVRDRLGRIFETGSLKPRERQIPVLMGGHHDAIIGFADTFQVDTDGWISYDITFRMDFLDQFARTNDSVTDWFDFSGFAHNIKASDPESKNIMYGEIIAIYAIPKPGIPSILAKDIPMHEDRPMTEQRTTQHKDRQANHDSFVRRVREMRERGYPVSEIAEATEHHESSVYSVLDHYGITPKPGAVTPSVDHVAAGKQKLVEYINGKLEVQDNFQIDESYIYVVWFTFILGNWKMVASTSLPDRMYYELTYNSAKDELYIDAYLKTDNVKINL